MTPPAPPLVPTLRALVVDLPVGARLPGERELAVRFGVARMTVRSAIADLARDGLVRTIHGSGTVRLPDPIGLQVRLGSFAEAVRAHGMTPSTRVLELVRDDDPPGPVRRFLGPHGVPGTVRLRRLRLGDDVPLAVERTWLPAVLADGLTEQVAGGSLYAYLAERGAPPDDGEELVTAALPDREECGLLQLPPSRPVLRLTRLATAAGIPVEYAEAAFPADRYTLSFPLGPRTRATANTRRKGITTRPSRSG